MKKRILFVAALSCLVYCNTNAQKYDEMSDDDKAKLTASPAGDHMKNLIYTLDMIEGSVDVKRYGDLSTYDERFPDFKKKYDEVKKEDPSLTVLDARVNTMMKNAEEKKKYVAWVKKTEGNRNKSGASSQLFTFNNDMAAAELAHIKNQESTFNDHMKSAIEAYDYIVVRDPNYDLSMDMADYNNYAAIYYKANNITPPPKKAPAAPLPDGLQIGVPMDEGITGPVHEKNIGKILFRKYAIGRNQMNETDINYETTFAPGDEVFGRFFLDKGMNKIPVYDDKGAAHENRNQVNGEDKYPGYATMTIDGKPVLGGKPFYVTTYKGVADQQDRSHLIGFTTSQIFVICDERNNMDIDKGLPAIFLALSDGEHKVKIDMWGGTTAMHTKAPIATGEFTYAKKKSGVTFEAVERGMTNPALEAQMLKVAQANGKDQGWKETFSKAKIKNEEWTVQRNELTSILVSHTIDGYIYATWPDGHCTYQVMAFKQMFDGAAYQKTLLYDGVGPQTRCDCSGK